MKTRSMILAVLALLAAGCASSTPHWDARFGSATRANLAAQTIRPAGSAVTQDAGGLDGRAARAAFDNYQRSFAQPETGQPAALVGER